MILSLRFGTLPPTSWHSWTPLRWRCLLSWESSTCCLESFSVSLTTCKIFGPISFGISSCIFCYLKFCIIAVVSNWLFAILGRYFKKPLNIYFGFIPEIVFMSCLFGYLIILIFYKWITYTVLDSKEAPSLLISFINMFLFSYNDPTNKPLYKGQVRHAC